MKQSAVQCSVVQCNAVQHIADTGPLGSERASKATLNDKELLESQSKKIEEEILNVESEEKSRVERVYKIKEAITGERKKGH